MNTMLHCPTTKLSDHWPTVTLSGKETVNKPESNEAAERASGSLERMVRRFPIGCYYSRAKWKYINGTSIPWEMIAPHEKQAMNNHGGQSLERLAQRGGLSACEALAVLEDRNWKPIDEDEAYARIEMLARSYSPNAELKHGAKNQ